MELTRSSSAGNNFEQPKRWSRLLKRDLCEDDETSCVTGNVFGCCTDRASLEGGKVFPHNSCQDVTEETTVSNNAIELLSNNERLCGSILSSFQQPETRKTSTELWSKSENSLKDDKSSETDFERIRKNFQEIGKRNSSTGQFLGVHVRAVSEPRLKVAKDETVSQSSQGSNQPLNNSTDRDLFVENLQKRTHSESYDEFKISSPIREYTKIPILERARARAFSDMHKQADYGGDGETTGRYIKHEGRKRRNPPKTKPRPKVKAESFIHNYLVNDQQGYSVASSVHNSSEVHPPPSSTRTQTNSETAATIDATNADEIISYELRAEETEDFSLKTNVEKPQTIQSKTDQDPITQRKFHAPQTVSSGTENEPCLRTLRDMPQKTHSRTDHDLVTKRNCDTPQTIPSRTDHESVTKIHRDMPQTLPTRADHVPVTRTYLSETDQDTVAKRNCDTSQTVRSRTNHDFVTRTYHDILQPQTSKTDNKTVPKNDDHDECRMQRHKEKSCGQIRGESKEDYLCQRHILDSYCLRRDRETSIPYAWVAIARRKFSNNLSRLGREGSSQDRRQRDSRDMSRQADDLLMSYRGRTKLEARIQKYLRAVATSSPPIERSSNVPLPQSHAGNSDSQASAGSSPLYSSGDAGHREAQSEDSPDTSPSNYRSPQPPASYVSGQARDVIRGMNKLLPRGENGQTDSPGWTPGKYSKLDKVKTTDIPHLDKLRGREEDERSSISDNDDRLLENWMIDILNDHLDSMDATRQAREAWKKMNSSEKRELLDRRMSSAPQIAKSSHYRSVSAPENGFPGRVSRLRRRYDNLAKAALEAGRGQEPPTYASHWTGGVDNQHHSSYRPRTTSHTTASSTTPPRPRSVERARQAAVTQLRLAASQNQSWDPEQDNHGFELEVMDRQDAVVDDLKRALRLRLQISEDSNHSQDASVNYKLLEMAEPLEEEHARISRPESAPCYNTFAAGEPRSKIRLDIMCPRKYERFNPNKTSGGYRSVHFAPRSVSRRDPEASQQLSCPTYADGTMEPYSCKQTLSQENQPWSENGMAQQYQLMASHPRLGSFLASYSNDPSPHDLDSAYCSPLPSLSPRLATIKRPVPTPRRRAPASREGIRSFRHVILPAILILSLSFLPFGFAYVTESLWPFIKLGMSMK